MEKIAGRLLDWDGIALCAWLKSDSAISVKI